MTDVDINGMRGQDCPECKRDWNDCACYMQIPILNARIIELEKKLVYFNTLLNYTLWDYIAGLVPEVKK